MGKTRMVFDTAGVLFRISAAQSKQAQMANADPKLRAGLALHVALNTLKKYYNLFKPDEIAITFEGRENWRKAYTKSDKCVSGRLYKGNRVYDNSMQPFFELIDAFKQLAIQHTGLVCLTHPKLEGDDLFAGYVQRYGNTDDNIVGIAGDKDFCQLLKYDNFRLCDPDTGKFRSVEDAEYFMFEKAFRGDTGDNVMSAYPRVRSTRLQKAYKDPFELNAILNEQWTFKDPETEVVKTYTVRDLYEENHTLMNLDRQPPEIKEIIASTIDEAYTKVGKFSFFHFTKFCGQNQLEQIANTSETFAAVLDPANRKVLEAGKKRVMSF